MRIYEDLLGKPGFGAIVVYENELATLPLDSYDRLEALRLKAKLAGLTGIVTAYEAGKNLMIVGEIGPQFQPLT